MEALDNQRRKSWMDKTEGLNFTHSIRKVWSLIRKLISSSFGSTQEYTTKQTNKPMANNTAEHFIKSSKRIADKQWTKKVKKQLRKEKRDLPNLILP